MCKIVADSFLLPSIIMKTVIESSALMMKGHSNTMSVTRNSKEEASEFLRPKQEQHMVSIV